MRKILITGGAGFIGSHFVEAICATFPESHVIVLDKMTYASDVNYIMPQIASRQAELVVGDICDYNLCYSHIKDCDLVVHAAAESHVDRSFHSSILFTQTNTLGTHTIMEACREAKTPRVIHVSTDEVYGEVLSGDCDETGIMNPTNPYSASKAAAEMIVNGYRHSFKLPVIVVRANNVYGIRQFPEKLIPRCIISLIEGKKIPLHGDGSNVRHYLSARDFADALVLLARSGIINETYNIGSHEGFTNREIATMVCEKFGLPFRDHVEFVGDRPFNDRRYSISWDKIAGLGWKQKHSIVTDMPEIVDWYKRNANSILDRIAQLRDDGNF